MHKKAGPSPAFRTIHSLNFGRKDARKMAPAIFGSSLSALPALCLRCGAGESPDQDGRDIADGATDLANCWKAA